MCTYSFGRNCEQLGSGGVVRGCEYFPTPVEPIATFRPSRGGSEVESTGLRALWITIRLIGAEVKAIAGVRYLENRLGHSWR